MHPSILLKILCFSLITFGSMPARCVQGLEKDMASRATRVLDKYTWECIVRDIEAITNTYRKMNKIMSLGLDNRVRIDAIHRMCRDHGQSSISSRQIIIVDVGAGPGDSVSTIAEICKQVSYIIAVDPSPRLLGNIAPSALCDRIVAVAENMPLRSSSVFGVTAFYAARDFKNLNRAISEILRVIDKGRIAIGDIFLPQGFLKSNAVKIWVCILVPLLALLFARKQWRHYRGLCRSLKGWLSVEQLCSLIKNIAKLDSYKVKCLEYSKYVLGGLGYVVAERST